MFLLTLPVQAKGLSEWPTSGPKRQQDKRILFISQDSKNGGISSLYRHFQAAIKTIKWREHYINGNNDPQQIKQILSSLNKKDYDGLVLGGISYQSFKQELQKVKQKGIVIVGWHAAEQPGSFEALFENVTSRPEDVAQLAVNFVLNQTKSPIGAVLFNDSRFEIANVKTRTMAKLLTDCDYCEVLAISDVQISQVNNLMPEHMRLLQQQFGERWTHNFAINDVYFDDIRGYLRSLERLDIKNISAGDGSFKALRRIKQDSGQQQASVVEPLNIQGWQIVDELNRALTGTLPSGFVSQPILADKHQLSNQAPSSLHQETYRNIWFGQ